eukprot:3764232-Rhodomonas_salina.1
MQVTAHEAFHGRSFDVHKLAPWGCYAVPHLKPKQRKPGKDAAKVRPGIFIWYAEHKGFSACQILDPKKRAIAYVPFEQVEFHQDCFPYKDPKGQKWPPLEITEFPDELTTQDGDELMCRPEMEPYVLNEGLFPLWKDIFPASPDPRP